VNQWWSEAGRTIVGNNQPDARDFGRNASQNYGLAIVEPSCEKPRACPNGLTKVAFTGDLTAAGHRRESVQSTQYDMGRGPESHVQRVTRKLVTGFGRFWWTAA